MYRSALSPIIRSLLLVMGRSGETLGIQTGDPHIHVLFPVSLSALVCMVQLRLTIWRKVCVCMGPFINHVHIFTCYFDPLPPFFHVIRRGGYRILERGG